MIARGPWRPLITVVGIVAVGLLLAVPAVSAGETVSATVTGGSRSISDLSAATFERRTITGLAQSTGASLDPFAIADFTGTGAGWHVTVQASRLTGEHHALASGSLTMALSSVTANGTTSPAPAVAEVPLTIDTDPLQIASATQDEGMGRYDFGAAMLTLHYPVDVYADAYAGVVTISVISAP
jgi:hypothetical protein